METLTELFDKGALIVSRYEVDSLLGRGGMGWVLRVRDRQFYNEFVALKILYPHLVATESSLLRFQNEVSITRRLSHPSIVQTFGFGRTDAGLAYVAMEYVEGQTLKELIREAGGELPFETVQRILIQLIGGLRYAHSQGIIHRDLKPENILVRADGVVKIADFGLAQVFREESHLTKTGNIVGTPQYMSPEQVQGLPLNCQTDIYSFGILGFELAAGAPPFEGGTLFEVAEKHLTEILPALEHRPGWFSWFLSLCTAKSLDERFSSFDKLLEFLDSYISTEVHHDVAELSGTSALAPQRADGWRSRLRPKFALLISALFVLVVFVSWVYLSRNNSEMRYRFTERLFRLEQSTGIDPRIVGKLHGVQHSFYESDFLFNRDTHHLLVRAYVDAGLDPNTKNGEEYLIHRILNEYPMVVEGQLVLLRTLIEAGADLNAREGEARTPVFLAVFRARTKALKILLERGADPNLTDGKGWTPLSRSVPSRGLEYTKLLLKHGADPDIRLPGGTTVLHLAAQHSEQSRALEQLRLLLAHGAEPNSQDELGRTPLMNAVGRKRNSPEQEEFLKLLAKKTDLSLKDKQGKTALMLAQEAGDKLAIAIITEFSKRP